MDAKVIKRRRTAVVGAFVVGVIMLLLIALLWLAGSRFLRPVDRYKAVFYGSVSGLLEGAAVELQGVTVGKVEDIHLTSDSPPRVEVDIGVKPGTPVKRDTVARLGGSLVTGIAFVQLSGGSEQAGNLEQDEPIRVDEKGSFEDIRRQAQDFSLQTREFLTGLNQDILNKKNREAFGQLIQDLNSTAHNLKAITADLASVENLASLKQSMANLNEATKRLNETALTFSSHREDLYRDINTALTRLNATLAGTQRIVTRGGPDIEHTLVELHRSSRRLDEVIDSLRTDPSSLIWGNRISDRERAK